jgi:hypothetical protein
MPAVTNLQLRMGHPPDSAEGVELQAIGALAIQIMRHCFIDFDREMPEWLEQTILERFGDIAEDRRGQIRFVFRRSPQSR